MAINMKRFAQFPRLLYDRIELRRMLGEDGIDSEKADQIRAEINAKTREMNFILDSIYTLEPSPGRYALLAHCIWGLSWEDAAVQYGNILMPGCLRHAGVLALEKIRNGGAKKEQCGTSANCLCEQK